MSFLPLSLLTCDSICQKHLSSTCPSGPSRKAELRPLNTGEQCPGSSSL